MNYPPIIFLTVVLGLLAGCTEPAQTTNARTFNVPSPADLEANFLNPPDAAKPRTWFHAMSSNMTKEGLTKDLEAMARVGIGGTLLFNVSQGIPVGDVVYNSDLHHEMIAHAAAESERLGLSFGVHNCDGWSSSGGPWVTPEESMKMVVWSETVVKEEGNKGGKEEGNKEGKGEGIKLAQPTTREGYYEDIAVLAYPALASELDDERNRPVTVVTSAGNYADAIVTDGRIDAEVTLGEKDGPAPWLQFTYREPKTIRAAAATFTDRNVTVTLHKSEDGKKFTDVRELFKVRTGKGEWAVNDHFGAETAKYFRLQFSQQVTLREARLTSTYFIENPLGRTAIARTEDADFGPIGTPDASMIIDPAEVLNLTDKLRPDGTLAYAFPVGNWMVMRFGQTSTGAFNNPASEEGRGLEVDKLSRPAFKKHYDAFVGKVVKKSRPAAPNALQYVEIDSYEMGGQNWTTGFDEIFKERKGYDFVPFLPLVAGRFMGTSSSAVLYDYREVISKLFTENYFGYFAELCRADGLVSYIEPYGFGPLNDLDVGGKADIPMGEFWMDREIDMVESAVSAAHIYGKTVVSAESFTTAPGLNWRGNPAMAKVSGDNAWAMGINEFMFHRFAHQANPNVTPGMTMNRWGFHFDRTQTWWDNAGAAWFKYIARGSYLLRQGHPVADLLIFVGDGTPNSRFKWNDFTPAIPHWLNYDNVNADVLINRIRLEDEAMVLPEGGSYRMLALKNCEKLTLPTLRRLVEIAESGVTVVGEAPKVLAGYGHREADYQEFTKLASQLTRQIEPLTDWQQQSGIRPDLLIKGHEDLNYEHRRVGATDIYFLVNSDSTANSFELEFRVSGKQPEHWDPMTGKTTDLARFGTTAWGTRVRLDLKAEESAFIVFRRPLTNAQNAISPDYQPENGLADFILSPEGQPTAMATANGNYSVSMVDGSTIRVSVDDLPAPTPIAAPWRVTFREEDGFAGELTFNELTDWAEHPDERVNYYSGTATYRTTFTTPMDWAGFEDREKSGARESGEVTKSTDAQRSLRDASRSGSGERFLLDLGEVDIVAEVTLNGKNLGVLWMPPFRTDITDALKPGENELLIEITNLWSNRLIGEERYPKQDGGYAMDGYQPKKKMPAWYRNNEPVPPGPRTTFTTADFYDADDALFPSGLKGPVRIFYAKAVPLR